MKDKDTVPMPRRLITLVVVTVALGLSLVTAITVPRATSETPRAEPAAPATTGRASAILLPFDAYQFSPSDTDTIEAAEDVLIRACMREQRLDWHMLPPPRSAGETESLNIRRYGLTGPETAARYGYHLPPPTRAEADREAVWDARDRLPSREKLVAFGENGVTGGCWGQAHARLLRDVPRDRTSLLGRYTVEAFDAARRTPEVKAETREWSRCMKRAGFNYADPFEAFGDPAWGKTARPSARELTAARTDVRCKEETNLLRIWVRTDERVQRDAIREHHDDFQEFAATKESWLNAAHRTLREGYRAYRTLAR
ncbi:hypothetical protein KQY30_35705 [Streptomyces sp. GMY02]|uniref:hypothetical protein n=1 Tax=Streptomyces sp. GMY02 TaxID=1333528 RepID=UPI001C2BA980|nr:hypothetical protein [Streptomyces sp. GMY02]QXE38761.1 hypothetical protein KQY30_35705 [Streptomyces sp. GMY02]